jgi:hypothetical protein
MKKRTVNTHTVMYTYNTDVLRLDIQYKRKMKKAKRCEFSVKAYLLKMGHLLNEESTEMLDLMRVEGKNHCLIRDEVDVQIRPTHRRGHRWSLLASWSLVHPSEEHLFKVS